MYSIAVADDDPLYRRVLVQVIRQNTVYSVLHEASDGVDLLRKINRSRDKLDIVFLDIDMPLMDGIATANFLKTSFPSIYSVAISNHSHPGIISDAFQAGVKGYLKKGSITQKSLESCMTSIFAGGIYLDPTLSSMDQLQAGDANTRFPWRILNGKEIVFLQLAAAEISYDEIANLMNIAKETIYNYQKSLKTKLGLRSLHEFVLYALRNGIARLAKYE